jgi:hypothetical protein
VARYRQTALSNLKESGAGTPAFYLAGDLKSTFR